MDKKLEEYRSKVRRKEFFNTIKQRLIRMVTFHPEAKHKKDETIEIPEEKFEEIESASSENEEILKNENLSDGEEESLYQNENTSSEASTLKYVMFVVWLLFWATCWMIAIELQLGVVFLLLSALFGIYFNTRTEPKRKGEVSAYSVFNENCEKIQGTLDAEQLQSEMLYGPFRAVH